MNDNQMAHILQLVPLSEAGLDSRTDEMTGVAARMGLEGPAFRGDNWPYLVKREETS